MGTFYVNAGEITDLGKIIYHPFQARSYFSTELPDYAMTRVASPALLSRLKLKYQREAALPQKMAAYVPAIK